MVNPIGITLVFIGIVVIIEGIVLFLLYREGKTVQQLRDLEKELNATRRELDSLKERLILLEGRVKENKGNEEEGEDEGIAQEKRFENKKRSPS
jgi:predicted  nucleic acid-binding Zn-ribbon protein